MKTIMVLTIMLVIILILTDCASSTPQTTVTIPPSTANLPTLTQILIPTTVSTTSTFTAPTQTLIPPTLIPAQPTPTVKLWLSARGYHDAVYDSHCDRLIVLGGVTGHSYSPTWLQDIWQYDFTTNTWEKMFVSQMPPMVKGTFGELAEGPMAYDEKANLTIFFDANIYGDNESLANKTWAYDCSSNTMTNLNAKGAPSGLLGARMVYDSKVDRLILFGGMIYSDSGNGNPVGSSNETWTYDYQTNTWTNMHPKLSPPGQNYFVMVYDEVADRVLAWIKPDTTVGANTLWAYDYTNNIWTPHPMDQPIFRNYNVGAYVPTLNKTFFFSGLSNTSTPINDLWTYDSATNTWSQLSPSGGPSPRGWATITYIPKVDKLVLIGGGKNLYYLTSEVWIYDPQQESWTRAGP